MKFTTLIYERFYELLLAAISKQYLPKGQLERYGISSYLTWNEKMENGEYIFDKLFHPYLTDRDHFYKKKSTYNPENVKFGKIKDEVLDICFPLINVNFPATFNKDEIELERRVKIYYQVFLEQYFPKYLKENPALIIFDRENESKKDWEKSRLEKTGVSDSEYEAAQAYLHEFAAFRVDKDYIDYQRSEIKSRVIDYFGTLERRDFFSASQFWTDEVY